MSTHKVSHDLSEPTDASIAAAKRAQARDRRAAGVGPDGRLRAQHVTPCVYPPWFASDEAFRAHLAALVACKDAAVREGKATC